MKIAALPWTVDLSTSSEYPPVAWVWGGELGELEIVGTVSAPPDAANAEKVAATAAVFAAAPAMLRELRKIVAALEPLHLDGVSPGTAADLLFSARAAIGPLDAIELVDAPTKPPAAFVEVF